jgi:phosphate transport system permease protein
MRERTRAEWRSARSFFYTRLMQIAAIAVCLFLVLIIAVLAIKSSLILGSNSLSELLFSTSWNPYKGEFGFLPIIIGTFLVTGIAMVIAIPISVLAAVYIAEYIPTRLRTVMKSFIDVLAGIPSVVYGMCAILVLVPLVRDIVAPMFGITSTGFCVFTAGIILAIMVFPIIIALCVESFRAVPDEAREITAALGASKWQTTRLVAFRAALPGVFSAILLGFGRAFGETIAVAMVVGNIPRIPATVFDSSATLPSIIASTYGEMMSIPLYDSAMMFLALVLILVVLMFNFFARLVTRRFAWNRRG